MPKHKFIVEYTLPYEHIVRVGIEADSGQTALTRAQALFDAGEIWDDGPGLPLLYDDFEEDGKSGEGLSFTLHAEVDEWPERGCCVEDAIRQNFAMQAARLMVEAYQRGGEDGGSIDWADMDAVHGLALKAVR